MSSLRGSDAPPSLEAANQAQIDDLVQRNRALEYLNNKLNEKLTAESNRSKEAVQDFQGRWHEKEKALRDECEDFLAYYRFVQLSTVSALETERVNALNEQKALREEKLLRLQRDFRITMFYAKERELEERVVELEEENERMVLERRELASTLKKKLAGIVAQLRLKDAEIESVNSERDVIEKDVSKLREENAQLQTSLASTSSRLERINLQLEGAQSSRSELEGINEDLKRKNYDLQRQIDKWQRLEHKGDAELDSLRKRKSELEAETQDLQGKLSREKEALTKSLEKEQKRVERLKDTVLEWKETAETHQRELEDTRTELIELRKEFEQLKAHTAPGEASSAKARKPFAQPNKSPVPGFEVEQDSLQRLKPSSRRNKGTASESETDEVQEIAPPPPRTSRKRRKMSPLMEEDENLSEVETVQSNNTKGKEIEVTKPKPRPRPRTKATNIPDAKESTLPSAPPPATTATTNQRKRKASADGSDAESDTPETKVAKTTAKPKRSRITSSASKKSSLRAESEEPTNAAANPLQKAKKRKINVFAGAGTQSSQLGFNFNLEANGFNIPTSLTPVKEAEGPVPNRTVSGAISGMGITGLIRGRMGGIR